MEPNGDKRRGFAVGAPARRSRDGNGKTAVRGGEAMAAKRTTAQGGFAQRNAAPAFARQTQKVGPVTGQRGFAERNATEREQAPGCERGASRGTKERTPEDPPGICGATFERSENGVASTLPPAGATTGQPGFAAGEMRPNGSKGGGGNRKPRVGKEEGPRFRGADYESPTAYFLSVKKVGKER